MTIRSALGRSPLVTFAVLVAFLWVLYAGTQVFGLIDVADPGPIGQGAVGGVVGLVVIAIALGLLVVLFGELGESEPGPETWPPSE
jgi:hypothetical protein